MINTAPLRRPTSVNYLWHVFKAAFFGLAAAGIAQLVIADAAKPADYAWLVVVWPFAAAFFRNIHALFARPYLRLSTEGVHLRYWPPVTFPRLALLRPTYRILERTIPWSAFRQCRTYTHTVNGIPVQRALILESESGEDTIGWDVLRPDVGALQVAILDFIERQFHQPQREALKVVDFCRQRFRVPLRIESRLAAAELVGLWALPFVATAIIAYLVPSFPDTGWVLVPVILVVSAGMYTREWVRTWGRRVLEFRNDGVALGASNPRLIRWEQIEFVRRVTPAAEGGPQGADSLEIHVQGGQVVRLFPVYRRSLDELQELLDPPPEKVALCYTRLAEGQEIEAAAVAAGLPGRSGATG